MITRATPRIVILTNGKSPRAKRSPPAVALRRNVHVDQLNDRSSYYLTLSDRAESRQHPTDGYTYHPYRLDEQDVCKVAIYMGSRGADDRLVHSRRSFYSRLTHFTALTDRHTCCALWSTH